VLASSDGAAFQWPDAIPWLLSALALGFSIFNFIRTNSVARRLRRDAIARDEFNSRIRTPIESALADLMFSLPRLKSLTRSYKGLDQLKLEVDLHAAALTDKAEKLFEALDSATAYRGSPERIGLSRLMRTGIASFNASHQHADRKRSTMKWSPHLTVLQRLSLISTVRSGDELSRRLSSTLPDNN
jgi:hypothetical protein